MVVIPGPARVIQVRVNARGHRSADAMTVAAAEVGHGDERVSD
jgi:hypothetical protein